MSELDGESTHELLSQLSSPGSSSRVLYQRTESQPSIRRTSTSTRSHALSHQQDLRAGHTSPLAYAAVNTYKANQRLSGTAPQLRSGVVSVGESDGSGVGLHEQGNRHRARTFSAQASESKGHSSQESGHQSLPTRARARTLGRAQTLGRTLARTTLKGGYEDDDDDDTSSSGYDGSPLARTERRQSQTAGVSMAQSSRYLPMTGRALASQPHTLELPQTLEADDSSQQSAQNQHSVGPGGVEDKLPNTTTMLEAYRSIISPRPAPPLEFAPRQDVRNFGGFGDIPTRPRAQSDSTHTQSGYQRSSPAMTTVPEVQIQSPNCNDGKGRRQGHLPDLKATAMRTQSAVVKDCESYLESDEDDVEDADDWMESFADVHMASDASVVSAMDEEDLLRSDNLICALPAEQYDPDPQYQITDIIGDLGGISEYEKSVYDNLSRGLVIGDSVHAGGEVGGFDQFLDNLDNSISNSSRGSTANIEDEYGGANQHYNYGQDPHDSVYDNIIVTHEEDGTEQSVSEDSDEEEDGGADEDDENTIGLGGNRNVRRGKLIGSGAFGRVYQGLDTTSGALLVIKQIDMHGKSAHAISTMEKEIQMLSQLDHRHIVKYLGAQIHKTEILNIFLEFVSGGSVADMLVKFGPFSVQLTSQYTRQLLYGLSYLHRNGIAHLDIKGGNVLIDKNGVVKLADFGNSVTAQHMQTESGGRTELRGTPNFMAPEVVRQQPYGSPADIWSVGCTVMEMLMGKPPWSEYSEPVAMMFHIARSKEAPQLPDGVGSRKTRSFLDRCFVRDPAERATVNELVLHEYIVRNTVKQFRPNKVLSRKMSLPVDLKKNTHQNSALANSPIGGGHSRLSRGGNGGFSSDMRNSQGRRSVGNALGYTPSVPALGASTLMNKSDFSAEGTPTSTLHRRGSSGSEPESDDGSNRGQKNNQLHVKPSRKTSAGDRSRLPRSPLTAVRSSLTSASGLAAPRSMSTLSLAKLQPVQSQGDFRPSSSMSALAAPHSNPNIDEHEKS